MERDRIKQKRVKIMCQVIKDVKRIVVKNEIEMSNRWKENYK